MTIEQVENLDLGIVPINSQNKLIIESGLEWVKENTTLEFDINSGEGVDTLPPSVKLFIIKFFD